MVPLQLTTSIKFFPIQEFFNNANAFRTDPPPIHPSSQFFLFFRGVVRLEQRESSLWWPPFILLPVVTIPFCRYGGLQYSISTPESVAAFAYWIIGLAWRDRRSHSRSQSSLGVVSLVEIEIERGVAVCCGVKVGGKGSDGTTAVCWGNGSDGATTLAGENGAGDETRPSPGGGT